MIVAVIVIDKILHPNLPPAKAEPFSFFIGLFVGPPVVRDAVYMPPKESPLTLTLSPEDGGEGTKPSAALLSTQH